MPITLGLFLFEDVEELDFAGPWEVFAAAASELDDLQVTTIAQEEGPITCAKGLRVLPEHSFESAPKLDVLLVPGGIGTRTQAKNEAALQWISRTAEDCRYVTSVCTGAYLLAQAGPARGKRVTTWWGFVEKLRETGLVAEVLDDVRFVRDGHVVTSAGVSAGIDMALWLLGQLYEPAVARKVQRYIEYYPAPPYTAET